MANAIYDAHRDDPEFGYRFLSDEVRAAGIAVTDRTVWKHCSQNRWWSAFGKKRSRVGKRAGPPVHDDLVCRDFTAMAPNMLWLTGITEHRTTEGKLYLYAVKNVFSYRIVGYSISNRMKAALAVTALNNAVARRGDVRGCIVHSDRGSQFRSRKFVRTLDWHNMIGSMGRIGAAGDNAAMESFFSLPQKNVLNRRRWATRDELRTAIVTWIERTYHPRQVDPHRIQDHHDHTGQSGRVTTVTYPCSRPLLFMVVHGVAGYATGCRCDQCFSAQRQREAQIAATEKARWSSITQQAQRAKAEQAQRRRQRQQHQQTIKAPSPSATEHSRLIYQHALANKDYRWLLDAERRKFNSIRTLTSRLLRNHGNPPESTELLWRQAEQMRALAKEHYNELADHLKNLADAKP